MPFGVGESVGAAYVKLYADGSGVPKDVDDAMKKIEGPLREAGERHAEIYDKAYEKQSDKDSEKQRDRLIKNLEKGMGKWKAVGQQLGSNFWDGVQLELSKEFGTDMGVQMRKQLEQGFERSGGDFKRLNAELQDIGAHAVRASGELERLTLKAEADAKKAADRIAADQKKATDKALADAERAAQHMSELREKEIRDLENDVRRTISETDGMVSSTERDMERARRSTESLQSSLRSFLTNMARGWEDIRKAVSKVPDELRHSEDAMKKVHRELDGLTHTERDLRRWSTRFGEANGVLDRFGFYAGRVFGKGARNDFVHFIGTVVGGLTNLILLGPKLALTIGGKLTDTFEKAGGGMRGLAAAGSQAALGLAGAFGALAAAGPVLAVAFAGISLAVGPVVALFSSLLGIVSALVASLGFALVGALGAVAGALVPLGAGIAVLVGGFMSLSDAQKEVLKADFKPASDAFKSLGDTAAKAITRDIGQNAKDLAPVIRSLNPLVAGLGDAIADIGTSWTKSLQGAGFARFTRVMQKNLPDMLRQIGNIAGNTIGGIGGLFEGMMPITQRFLNWLEQITGQFSEWANSKKGRQEIVDFFDRAGDSASTLKDWLGDVWGLLQKILDQGKGTGDTLFDKMGKNVRKFTQYLDDNPDALKDWFSNAKEVAVDLGNIAVSLGKIFDELDSPQNRKHLQEFLDALDAISTTDVKPDQNRWENMFGAFATFKRIATSDYLNAASGDFLGIGPATDWAIDKLSEIPDALREVGNSLTKWHLNPANSDFLGIGSGTDWVIEKIGSLGSTIGSAVGGWGKTVGQSFKDDFLDVLAGAGKDVWDAVTGWFSGGSGGGGMSLKAIKLPKIDIGKVDWSKAIDPLNWSRFIKPTSWGKWIKNLSWSRFLDPLKWTSFVKDLSWGTFVKVLSWTKYLNPLKWGDFIKDLSWSDFVKVLSWTKYLNPLHWADFVKDINWGELAGKLTWGSIIPDFPGWGSFIPDLNINAHINWPDPPGYLGKIVGHAAGGILTRPTYLLGGEAGREAVVPLDRPLAQVDPAVRELAAFARGIKPMAAGGVTDQVGKTVIVQEGAIQVIGVASPRATATAILNEYVARVG